MTAAMLADMATGERTRHRARRYADRVLHEIGTELRDARLGAGLSQQHLAKASGLSQARISRTEYGTRASPRLDELIAHSTALGLRLSVKAYPDGSPVRDAGQPRLESRLIQVVHPAYRWGTEVPVTGSRGDLRAWDLRFRGPTSIGMDAETRLRDIQSVLRRTETKWRDGSVERAVLLVADTRHNRAVLRDHRAALYSTFPADTAEVLAALRHGRPLERNGIVVL